MIFSYRVRKSPSELLSGTVEADDQRAAFLRLKRLGLYPIEIKRQRAASSNLREILGRRVGARDLALLARQLGTLLGAGVGLAESLSLVSAQVSNTRLREALLDIQNRVRGGETLSEAMGNYRNLFPPMLVSVVSAGETGGMLAEVFERAGDHYESLEELKGKVSGALIYPAFLFTVGVISIAILVTFVVPRFEELFAGFGQHLPWPTEALLSVSGFMAAWWWAVLGGLVAVGLAFYQITRRGAGRLAWDQLKLEIPLYGTLIIKLETARFARTLGSLLENGVGMLSSLDVVANTLGNQRIAADVRRVRDAVEQGSELGEALKKHTRFADIAFSMVRIGESSGATPEMLERIASVYQRDVDRAARAMTTLLEPVLIIIMGGGVAFVVLSILLPVFRLDAIIQ